VLFAVKSGKPTRPGHTCKKRARVGGRRSGRHGACL
jgi:hypothetical protein